MESRDFDRRMSKRKKMGNVGLGWRQCERLVTQIDWLRIARGPNRQTTWRRRIDRYFLELGSGFKRSGFRRGWK